MNVLSWATCTNVCMLLIKPHLPTILWHDRIACSLTCTCEPISSESSIANTDVTSGCVCTDCIWVTISFTLWNVCNKIWNTYSNYSGTLSFGTSEMWIYFVQQMFCSDYIPIDSCILYSLKCRQPAILYSREVVWSWTHITWTVRQHSPNDKTLAYLSQDCPMTEEHFYS